MAITAWRKSTRSGPNANCVEVALHGPAIRDSKNPTGANLNTEPSCWAPFLAALKAGRFDR